MTVGGFGTATEAAPAERFAALLNGDAGAEFGARRQDDFDYLGAVARRLLAIEASERAAVVGDPWAFKSWLTGADGVTDGGEQQMRNLLLNGLFPGTFEPIAAPEEKLAIADALGALVPDEARDDVDRTLLLIRRRLQAAHRSR